MSFFGNLLGGASTVLELFPDTDSVLPAIETSSFDDDAKALEEDWAKVSRDLESALIVEQQKQE